jgi:alpha-beta hydrolase superfamily lysophospholipase
MTPKFPAASPTPMDLMPVDSQAHPGGAGVLYGEQRFVAAPPGERGVQLLARVWRPAQGPTRAQVLLVHGYMEHGGRYRELAHTLARAGIATLCADLRGHGHSAGPRGYVRRFSDYLADLAGTQHALGEPPTFVLGHSLGGLIALTYAAQHPTKLAGLIVTNPYLADARPPPRHKVFIGRTLGRLFGRLNLPAGLSSSGLSHDTAVVARHALDPMIFKHANAAWFAASRKAQAQARELTRIGCPVLYVYSDADPIASPSANAQLAATLQDADKTVCVRTGELHEVLNEVHRTQLMAQIVAWITARVPAAAGGR